MLSNQSILSSIRDPDMFSRKTIEIAPVAFKAGRFPHRYIIVGVSLSTS